MKDTKITLNNTENQYENIFGMMQCYYQQESTPNVVKFSILDYPTTNKFIRIKQQL